METTMRKSYISSATNSRKESILFMMNTIHQPAILCKWGKNENITIIDFNESALRLLGFSHSGLKQKNIYEIFTSESVRSVRSNLNPLPYEGDDIWEAELLTKKRKRLKVEVTGYKFMLEGGIQILLSFRDISGYKEQLAKLAEYKSILELSESALKTGFWEYDLGSGKFTASDSLRSIFGLDDLELSAEDVPFLQLSDYLDRFDNIIEYFIKDSNLYEKEFEICRVADNAVISIWSAAAVNFYENKIFGIVQDVSGHKMTEKKLLEEKEKTDNKNLSRQALISEISNEIYAPMNRIVGYCELLNQPGMTPEARNSFIEYINKSCSHLHGLITDILDISRTETDKSPLRSDRIGLSELMNETLIAFKSEADKKGLGIRLNYGNLQNNTFVISDESKLFKVLCILLDNAMRFARQGFIEFGAYKRGASLEFYIRDTETGLTKAQKDVMSDLFLGNIAGSAQYYNGQDLGLALAKYYISMLGGSVWNDSVPGEGNTFYFTIPFITEFKVQEEIQATDDVAVSRRQRTCLLVDELEVNYFYLKALLSSSGIRVLWAKDNDEAIYMTITEPVDILIMSFKSSGSGHYDAIKIIRRKRPSILILAQSEQSESENFGRVLSEGFDDIISKPVNRDEFIKRVYPPSDMIA